MPRYILVVDDESVNRQILVRILSDEYKVLEAENRKEAMLTLNKTYKTLSAVVLDLRMPVMDGYEVLERMRKNPMLSQIPVIVATGSSDEGAEVKALSLGANDFISKPYDPDIILHRLRNTIKLRETSASINALQRDKLTGLYNRETFFEKAGEMICRQNPGYYVMVCYDIHNFKLINDQYGSTKGDDVLKYLADTFKNGFDPIGGICSRIMADNFAMLYPAEYIESDEVIAIRDATMHYSGLPSPITFAIGRYIINETTIPVSAMYDRAALASVSVKGRYDNRTAEYDESMRMNILREQEIINDMNTALMSGQFELWIQPQYNHVSKTLVGAEALVRWRHPEKGMIAPSVFIPVFERNGFIYEMDKHIWEQVCILLRRWMDEERSPLPVAVNVSRYDMLRSDFLQTITGLMKRYSLPSELLRLEITESAFTQDADQIISVVRQLREHGFTIEIDDFGSGYSSLNTLKDVPADILKLDMRFLKDDGTSSRGGNILEAVVRMAKWLGMPVIAEGVETKAQADYLKSIGCFYVQGYLYANPMPVCDYESLAVGSQKEHEMIALETIENLDNNAFWNPSSMDTLIFNSYVGGACIFEYHNNRIEIIRANDKYAKCIGGDSCTIEDVLNMTWEDHMDEAAATATEQAIQQAIDTGDDAVYEAVYYGLFGKEGRTYLRTTLRMLARTKDRYLLYATNVNITERKNAEEKLRMREEQYRLALEYSGNTVVSYDVAENALYMPPNVAAMFGVAEKLTDVPYKQIKQGLISSDTAEVYNDFFDRIRKGDKNGEAIFQAVVTGDRRSLKAKFFSVYDNTSAPVSAIIVLEDISEELEVREKAERDGMTGLYNKATTEMLIRRRLAHGDGNSCALLIVDLDNLKTINDSQGHICGDRAIRLIAETLQAQFRQTDIIGRVGGDEFMVFLDHCGSEAWLNSHMLTLMRELSVLRLGEQGQLPLRASIGVVTGKADTDSYDELFQKADLALYHVKRNNKNNFAFYTPDMDNADFLYKAKEEIDLWREGLLSKTETDMLLSAIATVYPMVISVNLTQNSYYMMQYGSYTTRSCVNTGIFDELIAEGVTTFHWDDRSSFLSAFSRDNLLRAYAEGEKAVSHVGRQLGDDNVYRLVQTDVIFVKNDESDDIWEITLARALNEQQYVFGAIRDSVGKEP